MAWICMKLLKILIFFLSVKDSFSTVTVFYLYPWTRVYHVILAECFKLPMNNVGLSTSTALPISSNNRVLRISITQLIACL